MKRLTTKKLTPKQELFCQYFALSGNGTQAALRSGTPNRNSAEVLASRWLRKVRIQHRIEEIRERAFEHLRRDTGKQLHRDIEIALDCGLGLPQARRAVSLMRKLKVYEYNNSVRREVEELEERFGVPFEEILDAISYAEVFPEELAFDRLHPKPSRWTSSARHLVRRF